MVRGKCIGVSVNGEELCGEEVSGEAMGEESKLGDEPGSRPSVEREGNPPSEIEGELDILSMSSRSSSASASAGMH